MPWKETSVMDERMKFIGRLLSGAKMAPLCREFGISRVTGYKIWKRYQDNGAVAIQSTDDLPQLPETLPYGTLNLRSTINAIAEKFALILLWKFEQVLPAAGGCDLTV